MQIDTTSRSSRAHSSAGSVVTKGMPKGSAGALGSLAPSAADRRHLSLRMIQQARNMEASAKAPAPITFRMHELRLITDPGPHLAASSLCTSNLTSIDTRAAQRVLSNHAFVLIAAADHPRFGRRRWPAVAFAARPRFGRLDD
jgi:hypothetical protein